MFNLEYSNSKKFKNACKLAFDKFQLLPLRNQEYKTINTHINWVDIYGYLYDITPQSIKIKNIDKNFNRFRFNKFKEYNLRLILRRHYKNYTISDDIKFKNMSEKICLVDNKGYKYSVNPHDVVRFKDENHSFNFTRNNLYAEYNIRKKLLVNDLYLIEKFKGTNEKHLIMDTKYDYVYYVELSRIINNESNPLRFSRSNPCTLHNIKIFLINNNSKCKLLSRNYVNGDLNLKWECLECGQTFKASLFNQIKRIENNDGICSECVYNQIIEYYSIGNILNRKLDNSINNESYLYFVNIKTINNEFKKIGITTRSVKNRLYDINNDISIESNINILYKSKLSLYECIFLENYLHNHFKDYSYIPEEYFRGYTECFKDITKQQVESQIGYFLSNKSTIINNMIDEHQNN